MAGPSGVPSIQNKLLCSTEGMTKHCCHDDPEIFYHSCCYTYMCVCVCVCIPSFQLLTTCLLWGKTHALFLRGGICFELVESLDTVKCLRKTQISDHGFPCWRAAGTKGFNSCSAAMEKTVASRTLASHSSPKMGLALSPRMEGCVLQCGHKKGGKEGWAGE